MSQHWSSIARKMPQIPPLSLSSFVHVILRTVANLLDEHVEEVFRGIARMPQISSVVLDWMSILLFDIFEDSKNVSILGKKRWIPHSDRSKLCCGPTSTWYSMFDLVLDQGRRAFASNGVGTTTTTRWQNETKSAHRRRVNDPQQRCITLNPKSLENMSQISH